MYAKLCEGSKEKRNGGRDDANFKCNLHLDVPISHQRGTGNISQSTVCLSSILGCETNSTSFLYDACTTLTLQPKFLYVHIHFLYFGLIGPYSRWNTYTHVHIAHCVVLYNEGDKDHPEFLKPLEEMLRDSRFYKKL